MILVNALYPPHCLHCGQEMEKHARLCSHCLSHFTLIVPEGRCEKCFSPISTLRGTCKSCREKRHVMRKLGACFESFGPASTLLQTFLKTGHPHLAREIASLIVLQIDSLQFPDFDAVTMIPNCLFNPQYVIGREVAKLLSIPFLTTLRKEVRVEPLFTLKRNCNLIHKRLFLLHTVMTTRQLIRGAAEALSHGWPQTLYGMTFCAT